MRQRVDRLKERLKNFNLDALLVTSLVNLRYLFGFSGSNAIALITSDLSYFITDRRYNQQVKEQVPNAEIIIAVEDLFGELKQIRALDDTMRLGFEAVHLSAKNYFYLKKAFPHLKLLASERIVERIASLKDDEEIENIRQAGLICRTVYNEVLPLIKSGISELEISAELSYRTRRLGSERDPFEPIVASGSRSALPHGISSQKIMSDGELIIIDFGAVTNGYAADITRTVILGNPSPRQKEMIDVTQEALKHAETSARPGMKGKELDAVTRNFLQKRSYGDYFQHSLGHGLGLNVHELPRVGQRSEDAIEVGNVITLEPGVYVPGIGGVRIEDDFVVTETGVENLTPFAREVVSVG